MESYGWWSLLPPIVAIAMAIQNLLWGIGVPIAGAIADRFGPVKVIAAGALIYALGVWGTSIADSPLELNVFAGLLTGLGVAFTSFSLASCGSRLAEVSPDPRKWSTAMVFERNR